MKKLLATTILLMLLFTSCYDRGTIITGSDDAVYQPFTYNGDTIDLYEYYPADEQRIWIGIHRNKEDINLTFKNGKQQNSIILIDKNSNKNTKIIQGYVISENDSVAVIRKIK